MDIIFDFGNVLINLDFGRTDQMLKQLLGDKINLAFYKENAADVFYEYEKGLISSDSFLVELQKYAPQISTNQIKEAWNALLLDIPKKRLDMLIELRKNHRVFLLSNTNEIHIEYVRDYLAREYQITDFETRFFDHVFYSYEMGMRKPDAEIYQTVQHNISASGNEILFFDDNQLNIDMSIQVGWQGIYHAPEAEITQHIQQYL